MPWHHQTFFMSEAWTIQHYIHQCGDLLPVITVVVATNADFKKKERKKKVQSPRTIFSLSWKLRVHLLNENRHLIKSKSDQRQVRKQCNMINTTTSQLHDPWEIFESTIKCWEQTNTSKCFVFESQRKREEPEESLLWWKQACNKFLKTEQNQLIYKFALFFLDNPCPYYSILSALLSL